MEDVVDFFIPKCQMLGITAEMFGICDDDDKAEKTPLHMSVSITKRNGALLSLIPQHFDLTLFISEGVSKVKAARPEGAEAHSPGHRPG